MRRSHFWSGFACGAAAMAGGALLVARLGRGGASRILRLEKSIQIAAPRDEVFAAWSDFEKLASMCNTITRVRTFVDRSHWTVNINGVPFEWDAEITQIVPEQEIAWKSLSGPKHSGRVTFGSVGSDTLVHVQMNYAPPLRLLRPLLSPFSGDLEGCIERVLREFKAAMERQTSQQKPA